MLPRSAFSSDEEYRAYLRDWFAGQALAGWCSDPHMGSNEKVAEGCYNVADAMLAEKDKRNG